MSEHTPGPWRPGHIDHWERGEKIAIRAEHIDDQPYIAFLPDLDGNVEANARLIAAAPDLLEACHAALCPHSLLTMEDAKQMCRAAIAKAEGK